MQYILSLSTKPSYTHVGLTGYAFFSDKDLDIDYIEVLKGHDTFQISKKLSRFYYVISGTGYFTIEGTRYEIQAGQLVCVPPKAEYSYSGTMSLLAIAKPHWFRGNDITTRWNPDVVSEGCAHEDLQRRPWLTRVAQKRILGISPVGAFLRLNRALWNTLPRSFTANAPMRSYGRILHRLARARIAGKHQDPPRTWFLRNRAALEVMRHIAERTDKHSVLRIAVLGCLTGAEVYSIAWWLRSSLPELKLTLHAVDPTTWAVETAKRGVYSSDAFELTGEGFCDMTEAEKAQLFDRNGNTMSVKAWLREGICWHVADVWDAALPEMIGAQNIVVANNCLCAVDAGRAEKALRNIARLVHPGGYVFVTGVDLDVRMRVAKEQGWTAVHDLLDDVHNGDWWARSQWPFHYAGLEPMDKGGQDSRIRYAAIFQVP